jgi:polyhydroxyalkanoate synthesis regulator phasin
MDLLWIAKQMVDFQRSAFEHTYQTAALVQEHMEKMASTTVREMEWLPEEGKRMIEEWTGNCRKGRSELKKAMDDQFDVFSGAFGQTVTVKAAK